MAGSPKEKLHEESAVIAETESETRQVYLRDGRTLVVSEAGGRDLVEIRSGSGVLEVRIELTERGPILRMESIKLELKADEAITLESPKVAIKAGGVKIESDEDVEVEAKGEVRVVGTTIHLN
jgi:hypothetical protein